MTEVYRLTRDEVARREGQSQAVRRFLSGTGTSDSYYLGDDAIPTQELYLGGGTVKPGEGKVSLVHTEEEADYLFVQGTDVGTIAEAEFHVGPASVLYLPLDTFPTMENDVDELLIYTVAVGFPRVGAEANVYESRSILEEEDAPRYYDWSSACRDVRISGQGWEKYLNGGSMTSTDICVVPVHHLYSSRRRRQEDE